MFTECFAVLLGHLATLGCLLDGQADPPALEVDVDDLHPQLLTRCHYLLGQVDMVHGHLGDVDQALDAVSNLHEGTERDKLGDAPVDQFADLVRVGELLPWVGLCGLERQADPFLGQIDVEHLDFDLVTHRHHRRRVIDMLPRQFRHVDESVHAAQVDEGTEVDHR